MVSNNTDDMCLIAHNGKTWDFRMFKATLSEQSDVKFELSIDTCDSISAFKQIDKDDGWRDAVPNSFIVI